MVGSASEKCGIGDHVMPTPRSDHIAIAITEGYNFIAFEMLMTTKSEIITAFLRSCRRSITMDDADIEMSTLLKARYRTFKNGIKAAMGFVAPEGSIDSCVVDLRSSIFIFFNGQLFPLTPKV